jgi:hypothetical protein
MLLAIDTLGLKQSHIHIRPVGQPVIPLPDRLESSVDRDARWGLAWRKVSLMMGKESDGILRSADPTLLEPLLRRPKMILMPVKQPVDNVKIANCNGN